jgi:hypothetical protein
MKRVYGMLEKRIYVYSGSDVRRGGDERMRIDETWEIGRNH